jgi:hypothetical protein
MNKKKRSLSSKQGKIQEGFVEVIKLVMCRIMME